MKNQPLCTVYQDILLSFNEKLYFSKILILMFYTVHDNVRKTSTFRKIEFVFSQYITFSFKKETSKTRQKVAFP